MLHYRLNEAEQRLAQYLARARQQYNDRHGIPNRKVMNRDPVETHLQGTGSEIAFCRMYNLYPDLEIGRHVGRDAIMHDGRTVDVKNTDLEKGRLIVEADKLQKPTDIYALLVGAFPEYRFAGFLYRDEILIESRWAAWLPKPAFAADQDALRKPNELRMVIRSADGQQSNAA